MLATLGGTRQAQSAIVSNWGWVQGRACPRVITRRSPQAGTGYDWLAVLTVQCRPHSVILEGDFASVFPFCDLCIGQRLKLIFHPWGRWMNACINVSRNLMNYLKSPKCPIQEEWLSRWYCNHLAERFAAIKMENNEEHERQENIR